MEDHEIYAQELEDGRLPPDDPGRWRQRLDQIRKHHDRVFSAGGNLGHLQHLFEGYRAFVEEGGGCDCPYSPGGARACSWMLGAAMAESDMRGQR